jgi:hypothetical protein
MDMKNIASSLVLLSILTVFPVADLRAAGDGLSFFKEEIFLTLGDASFTVKGNYYFRNERTDQTRFMIFYPFPVDSEMFYPDSITVSVMKDGDNGQALDYILADRGIRLGLKLDSGEVEMIQVSYRQKVRSQTARYILESTKTWGGFLEEADYYIEVPEHLEIIANSYDAFSLQPGEGMAIYAMRKQRFLPDHDIILRWRDKDN